LASLAAVVAAMAVPLGAPTASASLVGPVSTFGGAGSGAGQLDSPQGVAIQQTSGNVFVADAGNARVDVFGPDGTFIRAFGWGVADGKAQAEVCTSHCQAGISGSGPGQFSRPTSIAFGDVTGGASAGKVFVADAGNNTVEELGASGRFVATIDGTGSPQGDFQFLAGVAVDQSGNLWTADGGTGNVVEFNGKGQFVRQWADTHGSPSAIAVDSTHGALYLTTNSITERWTLTGQPQGEIDRPVFYGSEGFTGPSASALALDPGTGNLYVDHNADPMSDVTVYDHTGIPLDRLPLGSTDNSQGLAFRSSGPGDPTGKQGLYLSDASNANVTVFAPQTTAGAPLITAAASTPTGKTTATLAAGIVPLGHDTTCSFQFVGYADFNASGYSNATAVPCTPADLGSGLTYRAATADLSGLTTGTVYHFRVVATSSAGTATGDDQEFTAGPGVWAPMFHCPVDDPALLATDGVNSEAVCLASNSTHGSITIGNLTETTGNTNLQVGLVLDQSTGTFSAVQPSGGALVADPVRLDTPVGPVTAVPTSAGTPSNFDLFAGISPGQPIITIPIKIRLENNALLGPTCSIGSDANPILLNPQNGDLSNAKLIGGIANFDANGVPDPAGPEAALAITGAVQRDDTFAVPGATGCGQNGSLDAAVDAVAGVPSPSGSNLVVLEDASSSLALPAGGPPDFVIHNGQEFAHDWHVAFG
jgi:hypothetical protein